MLLLASYVPQPALQSGYGAVFPIKKIWKFPPDQPNNVNCLWSLHLGSSNVFTCNNVENQENVFIKTNYCHDRKKARKILKSISHRKSYFQFVFLFAQQEKNYFPRKKFSLFSTSFRKVIEFVSVGGMQLCHIRSSFRKSLCKL